MTASKFDKDETKQWSSFFSLSHTGPVVVCLKWFSIFRNLFFVPSQGLHSDFTISHFYAEYSATNNSSKKWIPLHLTFQLKDVCQISRVEMTCWLQTTIAELVIGENSAVFKKHNSHECLKKRNYFSWFEWFSCFSSCYCQRPLEICSTTEGFISRETLWCAFLLAKTIGWKHM